MVRRWYIRKALESFQSLKSVLNELSEEEIITALDLESASQRRLSVIERLISRAIRLRELSYATQLKDKYYGSS